MPRLLIVAAALMLIPAPPASAKEAPPTMTRFNVECPAPRECARLERERRACDAGKECGAFLATMRRLLPGYDCQRSFDGRHVVPAIWLCLDVKDHTLVHDGFGDALGTLSKLNARPALELFASAALREALTGEYAEAYRELSDKAERRLVVGEDAETGGPGPYLEGGNWPGMKARASSVSPAVQGESFDAMRAVDGKAFTAWCAARSGGPDWIEVSLRRPSWLEGKPFCGFTLVPGDARTQGRYLAHKRPTRVRIASCSHPDASFETDLGALQDFNQALLHLRVPAGALGNEGECARVTLLGVTQGGPGPACLSEVAPEYVCGN